MNKPSQKDQEAYELSKKVRAVVGLKFAGDMFKQPEEFKRFVDEQYAKYWQLQPNGPDE